MSPEVACPMENVTFTCTGSGNTLGWNLPDGFKIEIVARDGGELNMPDTFGDYIVAVTAFNGTSVTSTLTTAAVNGITVTCLEGSPPSVNVGTGTIILAGKH